MTSESNLIPCLPENAPFTPEQRAYLNGFLAGLFSRAPAAATTAALPVAAPLSPLSILYGSQTGNAEGLAKRIAREAGKRGFAPTVQDLAKYPVAQLATEQRLLIIASTFGDGEPPDNAKGFWSFLGGAAAPKLAQTRYSVCALGDSNYPKFCGFGKEVDARFEALGGKRVHPRVDCDVEFEEPFARWMNEALGRIGEMGGSSGGQSQEREIPLVTITSLDNEPAAVVPQYSRSNPYSAALRTNRILNATGASKETRHFEIDLGGSGLAYEVGDALGIVPANCPELVEEILGALKCSGDESVPDRDGALLPLREALLGHYEIRMIPQPLLEAMSGRTGDSQLKRLTAPGVNGELSKFLWGREIIDLLLAHPAVTFTSAEFFSLLKPLQPRLYSISSSPKTHPGQVHLTINIVRYESLARKRKGVCSTFLAERITDGTPVEVFVQANRNFRPPADGNTPMIMVGPGTGIAPFRAFLEERQAVGAKGKNWLFFGDQRSATDFMYRGELEEMRRAGILTRLDTAFSRDQVEKIYVQQRMRENAGELFAWLESGAHFYVCGDAQRMARDVDVVLHEVVQVAGSRTAEQAADYVSSLRSAKRYLRDVY